MTSAAGRGGPRGVSTASTAASAQQAATPGPLSGLRIVVTRAAAQTASTRAALRGAGARVQALPLSVVGPPADPHALEAAIRSLGKYDWIVCTSANGVAALLDHPEAIVPAQLRFAAVGPGTAAAVRRRGREAAITAAADSIDSRGLLAALVDRLDPKSRVLLPQAADARSDLASGLTAAGFVVTRVDAYEKQLPRGANARARRLFDTEPIGWVTFHSGSAARRFADLFGADWPARRPELRAASIGAVTSAQLRAVGVEPAAEAKLPGDAELVAAIIEAHTAQRNAR